MITFRKNISSCRIKQPELAEELKNLKPNPRVQAVETKSGIPSLRADNITLHSTYDPIEEAKTWVSHYGDDIQGASVVYVLGFGLGYHVRELCRHAKQKIVVVEPRMDILREAFSLVDLSAIFSRARIVTDIDITPSGDNVTVLEHKPSVALNREFFHAIKARIRSAAAIGKGLRILVVGPVYGGSLPIAGYCSAALRKLGHTVEYFDNSRFHDILFFSRDTIKERARFTRCTEILSAMISEIILARCESFRPDLVFALAQAPLTPECLSELKKQNIPTAFWFVEDFRLMEYWRRIAHLYQYFFTIQRGAFLDELEGIGIRNYHYLPVAADPQVHRTVRLGIKEKMSYGSDVSFVGAGYYNRRRFFRGLMDLDFRIWGSDWDLSSALGKYIQNSGERVSTEDAVRIFNAAKININLHSSAHHKGINPFGDFVNPRTFEIASCGGFQLVDRRADIGEFFEEGQEIVCFSDLDDLRNKILYYLDHTDERLKISARGRQRVIREHTYEHRMREMLSFIAECGYEPPVRDSDGEDVKKLIRESQDNEELREYLSRFADRKSLSMAEIMEAINSGEGEICRAEKMFMLMHEFVRT